MQYKYTCVHPGFVWAQLHLEAPWQYTSLEALQEWVDPAIFISSLSIFVISWAGRDKWEFRTWWLEGDVVSPILGNVWSHTPE